MNSANTLAITGYVDSVLIYYNDNLLGVGNGFNDATNDDAYGRECMNNNHVITGRCECGQTQVAISKPPMLRFHCHCTICQTLYKKPFSDVTVMWAKDALLTQGEHIEYRRPGLLLKRGVCTQCKQPIFATMTLFPGVKFAFIPANRYDDPTMLPKPSAHIFFHRSNVPIEDGIEKYRGFIRSELVVSWLIVKSAFVQLLNR